MASREGVGPLSDREAKWRPERVESPGYRGGEGNSTGLCMVPVDLSSP